ncbi:MAG: DUF5683 domain-containing protein [Ignavibacteriaceae bacterium]
MKSLANHIIKTAILILFFSSLQFAQQNSLPAQNNSSIDSVFVMTKSPWGAVLRSAILPGWGQFYNESYLKIPIIWGLSAWFIYQWNWNNKNYQQYKNLYLQNNDYNYRQYRDFYHDQRDLFSIYIGLTYFLNLVDAYVDAELFDFSVKENNYTGQPMLNLRIKF